MPPPHSSLATNAGQVPAARPALSAGDKIAACAGILTLALTGEIYQRTSGFIVKHLRPGAADYIYARATVRSYEIMLGALLAALLLQPLLTAGIDRLRGHWRRRHTALALLGACAFLCVFLVHTGRHQFGGFDFSILMELGWRQVQGQRLYVDFVAPTPPGFNLGIKYAFQIFGVSWDANLYLSAIFACATFLWMFWLMLQLEFGTLAAMGTAFAIECEAMLLLSFWWYNNSAMVLAAVFLLACLVYARRPQSIPISIPVQASYIAALVLLALMKPNVAGIAIAGGVLLLLIATERRWRLVLLTLGAAFAVLLIFAANHISLSAMLASYREASRLRGGFSDFGFLQLDFLEQTAAECALFALALPWLWMLPRTIRFARGQGRRGVALQLFFPLTLLLAVYSLRTNGDFWLVECAPLLAVGGFVVYGRTAGELSSGERSTGARTPGPAVMRRFFTALLCASIASSLYMGALRLRVYSIGAGKFFEWTDNENPIDSGPLRHMRVSRAMIEVEQQIGAAAASNPGPRFFGPRVDFNYAVLGLPSPEHFAAWWHPGVAFAIEQEPQLVQVWKDHRFQTLIFLKDDYTFYPAELMDAIARDYTRDDRYTRITVYHRRPGTP